MFGHVKIPTILVCFCLTCSLHVTTLCVWLCWVLFLVTWGNQPTKRPSSLNFEVPGWSLSYYQQSSQLCDLRSNPSRSFQSFSGWSHWCLWATWLANSLGHENPKLPPVCFVAICVCHVPMTICRFAGLMTLLQLSFATVSAAGYVHRHGSACVTTNFLPL